jgi:hypothetical protein
MPTSRSPQLSPSGLMKHLRMGSVRIPHHFLTTRMEPWDFIKSSVLYLSVHMKLSLCLSFFISDVASEARRWAPLWPPAFSPPNPAEVSTIPYENLFRPLSSDRLQPPAQRRARGLLVISSFSEKFKTCHINAFHLNSDRKILNNLIGCIHGMHIFIYEH